MKIRFLKIMEKHKVAVIFVTITAVLRFSDTKERQSVLQLKRKGTDFSLIGHLIESYSGVSLLQCSLHCSKNTLCAAINFHSISQKCELSSATSHEFPSDVVDSVGVWHYHVTIPKRVASVANYPTIMSTTPIKTTSEVRVVQTTPSTTTRRVKQTTAIFTGTAEMTSGVKSRTKLTTLLTTGETTGKTKEQSTEQYIEPTTRSMTDPTMHLTRELSTEQTMRPEVEQTTAPTTQETTSEQTTGCEQVTDPCGKTFTSECESVASPNYPDKIPNGVSCEFSVQAPEGQNVQLFFDYFDIENHPSCSYDYVGFYDGAPPSAATGRYRACGPSASPVVTNNGFIHIHIFTNNIQRSGGLYARLVFSKICGKTFSTSGEQISSPFYPDPLPIGVQYVCQFTISAPTDSTVRIEFSFLQMEEQNRCLYDRIEFYEEAYAETGEPLETVCGYYSVPVDPIYLNTNSVVVKVVCDQVYASNGFVFTYWFE